MEQNQKLNNITNKKLFLVFIVLLVLNSICLINLAGKNGAQNLDGSYSEANSPELIANVLLGITFAIPFVLALLSAIINIFVNKKQSYRKRFIKTYLVTLLIVYAFFLIRYSMLIFSN